MAHMSGRASRTAAAAAACVAALAFYTSFGVLTVTDAGPRPERIGLLPPVWILAVAATAALICTAVVRRPHNWYRPLLLAACLLLPWLPLHVPDVFLIWAGPAALGVWAAVAGGVLAPGVGARLSAFQRRWLASPGRGALAAGVLACVIYLGASLQMRPLFPGGDEPHYLIITQSLLKDRDLRIENNHQQGDMLAYFPRQERPHYLQRGQDGQIYSVHAPGLPAVVAPAFLVAGYRGVVCFLAFVSALGTLLVWRAAYHVTGSPGAAWFGWATAALTVPMFFHAWAVYPEALSGTLIMTGVVALARPWPTSGRAGPTENAEPPAGEARPAWQWALQGAALAALPWLHTRYAVLALMLGACLAVRLATGPSPAKRIAALLAVPLVSAAAWLAYFQVIYGTFSPAAPYGQSTTTKLAYVPVGLPALVFDQQFGVIPYAPVFVVALFGVVALLRARPRVGLELVAVVLPYACVAAAFRMWWAGWSAPARFLVPVLMPMGVAAAAAWARQSRPARALSLTALVASVLVTVTLIFADGGWLIFNDRDGYARWLEWASPLVNLPRGVPSFIFGTYQAAMAHVGLWAAALSVPIVAALTWARRARLGPFALGLVMPAAVALGLMVAVTAVWQVTDTRGLAALTAQLQVLRASRSSALAVGVELPRLTLMPPGPALQTLRLSSSERRPKAEDDPLLLLPGVPAGTYELAPETLLAAQGTLRAFVGRTPLPIESWMVNPSTRQAQRTVRLPCDVDGLVVTGDDAAGRSIRRLALKPVAIDAPGNCPVASPASRAARYGVATVFSFDDRVFLEESGFWVGGGTETTVVIVPDDPRQPTRVRLRNGAVANEVTVASGRWVDRFPLKPREERTVEVDFASRAGVLSLRIGSTAGFRPSDVDPASEDRRFLGCWFELR